jgi:hypothetical protein
LQPASLAVNAGDNDLALGLLDIPLLTDQRGGAFPRIAAGQVDIGAYELAANLTPGISAPVSQVIDEDHLLVFSSSNGNAISISDADAEDGEIRLSVSATGGTLTLASVAELTFSVGDGDQDSAMTIFGSQDAINEALAGLMFQPAVHYRVVWPPARRRQQPPRKPGQSAPHGPKV